MNLGIHGLAAGLGEGLQLPVNLLVAQLPVLILVVALDAYCLRPRPHRSTTCWPPPRLALGTVPEVPHRVDEPVKVHGVSPSE
jgi:hypothetical protein